MISTKSSDFVTNAKSNSFAAIEHSSVTAPPSSNVGRLSMVVLGINIAQCLEVFEKYFLFLCPTHYLKCRKMISLIHLS